MDRRCYECVSGHRAVLIVAGIESIWLYQYLAHSHIHTAHMILPMKFVLSILLFLLVSLSVESAHAQLSVNKSVLEFSAEQKIQDIEIFNSGQFKIYVDMKVAEIMNPEQAKPERVDLTDPRTAAILVTPQQVMVPPGQRKRVRVILRGAPEIRDRVFRLAIKPYTGDVKVDNAGSFGKTSAIKVLLGYDLLLLSRPLDIKPKLEVSRTEQHITFTNSGNTNILLRRIVQCPQDKSDCSELQPNRLYAGETLQLELPFKGSVEEFPVEVWQSVGLTSSRDLF